MMDAVGNGEREPSIFPVFMRSMTPSAPAATFKHLCSHSSEARWSRANVSVHICSIMCMYALLTACVQSGVCTLQCKERVREYPFRDHFDRYAPKQTGREQLINMHAACMYTYLF